MYEPQVGDEVAVISGPFSGTQGVVTDVFGTGPRAGVTIEYRAYGELVSLTFLANELAQAAVSA